MIEAIVIYSHQSSLEWLPCHGFYPFSTASYIWPRKHPYLLVEMGHIQLTLGLQVESVEQLLLMMAKLSAGQETLGWKMQVSEKASVVIPMVDAYIVEISKCE